MTIDLTFQAPYSLAMLFHARGNRKPVFLAAHSSGQLTGDFNGGGAVTVYGDDKGGIAAFRAKLDTFIKNLKFDDIGNKDTSLLCKTSIKLPEGFKRKIPVNVKNFTKDYLPTKKKVPELKWDDLVDIVQENETMYNLDLSGLKEKWRTVEFQDKVFSFLLTPDLATRYEQNPCYFRCLFEKVLFALTEKDIAVKIKPRPELFKNKS